MTETKKAKRHIWKHNDDGTVECRICRLQYSVGMGRLSEYSADGGKTWRCSKKVPPCEVER